MKSSLTQKISFIIFLIILIVSCKKEDPIKEETYGKLQFNFQHYYDGLPIMYDSLIYENEAGNKLMINEIQYFISDIILIDENDKQVFIKENNSIYYVDIDIPSTLTWDLADNIPIGNYKAISFTFGISASKNIPNMFVNPPERDMFWPIHLGGEQGGYHYLKLNGKWLPDTETQLTPFNFHLGVGQEYSDSGTIVGFIQNYFNLTLHSNIIIEKDKTTQITLVMNIEEWFKNPHIFDFDVWGSFIMQNQEAMKIACENGKTVFKIKKVTIQ